MKMTKNKTLAPAGLLLGALLLTACGGDNGTTSGDASSGSETPSSTTTEYNDADVTFAQGMIPHHQQAVEMAQQAEAQGESEEVKALATKIEAAQAPEIEQLTTWLDRWGAEAPSGQFDHGDMGHGDPDSPMSGMMTEEDMAALGDESGAEFDQMFLEMMIEHHRGAVTMAETQVDEGENPDAVAMAEEIISTQNAEIEQMEQLLGS